MIKFKTHPKKLRGAEVRSWESVEKNVKIIGFSIFSGKF